MKFMQLCWTTGLGCCGYMKFLMEVTMSWACKLQERKIFRKCMPRSLAQKRQLMVWSTGPASSTWQKHGQNHAHLIGKRVRRVVMQGWWRGWRTNHPRRSYLGKPGKSDCITCFGEWHVASTRRIWRFGSILVAAMCHRSLAQYRFSRRRASSTRSRRRDSVLDALLIRSKTSWMLARQEGRTFGPCVLSRRRCHARLKKWWTWQNPRTMQCRKCPELLNR